jgi:F-type H+-transporting ATPase subunit delta
VAGEVLSVAGLAGRYASALFDLADEKQAHDAVAADLRQLRKLIHESEDLSRFLRSPLYSRDVQVAALDAVLKKAAAGDLARRFALVVASNRRLYALGGMIDAYLAILAKRRGEVTAKVTVARPLEAAQMTLLEESLRRSVGGQVKVETRIDESLIGGLIVQIGSRMVDASLRSKLMRLQTAMKGA